MRWSVASSIFSRHYLSFRLVHPLSNMVSEERVEEMNTGSLLRGGSGDTVVASGYNSDFQQTQKMH